VSGFEDHFSDFADCYARHRPRYPEGLFAYLAGIAPGRTLAWDCATGNGQAAVALAGRFERVHATDASRAQIDRAEPHDRVVYRVEAAEEVSLRSGSVDLITNLGSTQSSGTTMITSLPGSGRSASVTWMIGTAVCRSRSTRSRHPGSTWRPTGIWAN
jgi:hypothetical protein